MEERKACRLGKFRISENQGYAFRDGYIDSITPVSAMGPGGASGHVYKKVLHDYYERMYWGTTYMCNEPEIIERHQYVEEDTGLAFNATQFLHALYNKTLLVIGDSPAEQLFLALDVELKPFLDTTTNAVYNATSNGNGTHLWFDYKDAAHLIPNEPISEIRPFAAVRAYKPPFHTVRVFFCKDPFVAPFLGRPLDDFCVRPMLANASVILLAFGAHYKIPDNLASLDSYYSEQRAATVKFEAHCLQMRQYIHNHRTAHSRYDIIWRLQSHTGPIDEYNAIFSKFGGRDYQSALTQHASKRASGFTWDTHHNRTSEWVRQYNGASRSVAHLYGDYLLNHHDLSYQLIKHEHDRTLQLAVAHNQSDNDSWIMNQRLSIHSDSLHYCSGGLFRASNLLLQRIVEHINACHAEV